MSKTNRRTTREPVLRLKEKASEDKISKLLASDKISEEQKEMLFKYKQKISEGYVTVNYFYSRVMDMGRLYADGGLSLQSFKKNIRHTLASEDYIDVDMVNAHPTLLRQYCQKKGIACKMLSRYVLNRDKWLGELMEIHNISRDQAKTLILRLMYLGNYRLIDKNENEINPDEKSPKILEFSMELKRIAKIICGIETNIRKVVENNQEKENVRSSVLSITIQKLEKKCLDSAAKFYKSKGYDIGVLCFDGFMMEKKVGGDEEAKNLLEECSAHVNKNTGYNIKFDLKEMNMGIELPTEGSIVKDDKEVQEKLFRLEDPNYFKYCHGILYIFHEKTGKFDKCTKESDAPLNYYLSKHSKYFCVEVSTNPKYSKLKSYGRDAALMKKVYPYVLIAARDDDWLERTAQSSLGYLLFQNGIYDMNKGIFTKGFNPNIVFHCSINRNFPEKIKEDYAYANKLSFRAMCGSDKKSLPLRVAFARALAGDISAKKFYFCPGKTNAGKSKLVAMFRTCFGDFIQPFNAENLAYNEKAGTSDEAQKNRWAYLIRFSRIIFSNEINMKKIINGNDIKKVASGGDEIIGRTHFQEEVKFKPHFTAFCMLNDIPEIQPLDNAVYGRLIYYEFEKQFVEEPTEEYHVKMDKDLENKIQQDKFINGFIHLILNAYSYYLKNGQPEFDTITKEEWTAEGMRDKNLANIIEEYYEITGDGSDHVTVSEFTDFRRNNKNEFSTISNKRFSEVLKTMGAKQGKAGKNRTRVWTCIKKIDDDM